MWQRAWVKDIETSELLTEVPFKSFRSGQMLDICGIFDMIIKV